MAFLVLMVLPMLRVAGHGLADGGRASGWVKPPSPPGVRATDEEYVVAGKVYQGYLALPPNKTAPKGGVLVAHQFMGLGDYEQARADQMAGMGYVAFAMDVYGKGVRCNNETCAIDTMNAATSDITQLRGLISAGTSQLLKHFSDKDRLLAMGYCFGGDMVLELARHPGKGASEGVTYKAVSSFHGLLDAWNGDTADVGEITTSVQAHHGALDFQGDNALLALEKELSIGTVNSNATWETIKYANCQHGFSEPGTPVYDARSALQSHKSTFEFFEIALGLEDPVADPFQIDPICTHSTATNNIMV